jgi:hypothetical protein
MNRYDVSIQLYAVINETVEAENEEAAIEKVRNSHTNLITHLEDDLGLAIDDYCEEATLRVPYDDELKQ